MKNIHGTRNYLIEEINQNELISKEREKFSRAPNYTEYLLIVISAITGGVSICAFACFVGSAIGITSSATGLKICLITAGIKMYDSIIKKNKKRHDKILSLAKSKLKNVKVVISRALIDSNISHDEFVLICNVPEEFDDM